MPLKRGEIAHNTPSTEIAPVVIPEPVEAPPVPDAAPETVKVDPETAMVLQHKYIAALEAGVVEAKVALDRMITQNNRK